MNPAAYNLTYELRSALETQILKDLTPTNYSAHCGRKPRIISL